MKNTKIINNSISKMTNLLKIDLAADRIKEIINDKSPLQTDSEEKIKSLSDAFYYSLRNLNTQLTKRIIKRMYYLITLKELENDLTQKILEKYFLLIDDSIHMRVSVVHELIIRSKILAYEEFAFTLSNYLLLKNDLNPLILDQQILNIYYEAIKANDFEELFKFFLFAERYSKEVLKEGQFNSNKYTLDQVIRMLREKKDVIIKKYKVKKLLIFGSFVKETNNQYSDVDLLVSFDDEVISSKKYNLVINLKKYLESEYNIGFDILNLGYVVMNLEYSKLDKVIKII